jgi:hypothetical protein
MRVLTEARAIEIIREEWESKLQRLREESEQVHLRAAGSLKGRPIVAVGTEVKCKQDGLIYTVKSLSDGGEVYVLQSPDGQLVRLSRSDLEGKDFVLP